MPVLRPRPTRAKPAPRRTALAAEAAAAMKALREHPAPMPQRPEPEPMLCTLVEAAFDDPKWVFEPKLDGLRVLCHYDGKTAHLVSRNEKSQDVQFPDVVEALAETLDKPAILDGEIVCLDERGLSSFRALQQRFHLEDKEEILRRMDQFPAYLYVFDLLYYDRYDARALPLRQRKAILRDVVKWSDRVRWTEGTAGKGVKPLEQACREAGEGIVGKHLDSTYYGGRAWEWVKIKCIGRQEFVVGGFTDPQRSRVGLGALLVGYYTDDGSEFLYAGKVGTGFDREGLLDLREKLDKLEQTETPFAGHVAPRGPGVHWVKPELVAEIAFGEWTQNGLLRQPRFEGLRMDKKAKQVRRERPKSAAARPKSKARKSKAQGREAPASTAAAAPPDTSLEAYREKRDFSITSEPPPKKAKASTKPTFVIQEHHATRLHWDFRLEAEGVLKSWAVTNQPSMDPSVKRLAVQTEDHPLAYGSFEGDIPEGQYGAGHVEIWDKGTYTNRGTRSVVEGLRAGKLEFELHGKKLKGAFALVRMAGRGRGENWLLIKMRDQHAEPGSAGGGADSKAKSNGKATGGTKSSRSTAKKRTALLDATTSAKPQASGEPVRVEFTNVDRLMFPEPGYTKGDVLEFYLKIAPLLLPHLRDRPITVQRDPDGLAGNTPMFWQKNTPAHYPKWIPRVRLPSERGDPVDYALVNDEETLLYFVNQGTMTFHVWFSRVADLDKPDFVLFDLDPGGAKFTDVVRIARALHDILGDQKVPNFPKTSGKTGLHVLTPWTKPGGYDEARAWAMETAQTLIKELPDIATVERSKAEREGRVYVDVMQNAKGHHAVPPYVLRAVPEATVSTPLKWSEVTAKLDPKDYTIKSIFKRLKGGAKADLMGELVR